MSLSYKRWIHQLLANLMTHMNLAGWEIELTFSPKPHAEDGDCRTADINVLAEYQKAHICLYPSVEDSFKKGQLGFIVTILVHELCHTITFPFSDFAEPFISKVTEPFFTKQLELATQKITVLVLKTLPKKVIPDGVKYNPAPKKHKLRPANDTTVSSNIHGEHSK